MAILVGMSEEARGVNVEIGDEPITIGRKSDNSLHIDNGTVSGHHAVVSKDEEGYTLRDLKSTNGTRLNQKKAEQERLKPKDIIQFGSVEFMFDVSPGEVLKAKPDQTASVEVDPGPATAPQSFGNISPFGARKSEKKGLWFLLIILVGLVALAAVVILFIKLISES